MCIYIYNIYTYIYTYMNILKFCCKIWGKKIMGKNTHPTHGLFFNHLNMCVRACVCACVCGFRRLRENVDGRDQIHCTEYEFETHT